MLEQLEALDSHSPLATAQLINTLSESADPDLALQGLCWIAEALQRHEYDVAAFSRTLEMDDDFRRRLVFVTWIVVLVAAIAGGSALAGHWATPDDGPN